MAPQRNKDVLLPGTLIVMSERVRLIWASNTTGVIMFRSVKSLCSAETITEDAEEANQKPKTKSTQNMFMWSRMSQLGDD